MTANDDVLVELLWPLKHHGAHVPRGSRVRVTQDEANDLEAVGAGRRVATGPSDSAKRYARRDMRVGERD